MQASTAALVAGVLLLASSAQISGAAIGAATPAAESSGVSSTEFCSVSRTVRLAAGSAESSVRLRLQSAATPAAAAPCRLQVAAPASNLLSVELVPLLPEDAQGNDDFGSSSSSEDAEDGGRDAEHGDRDADNGDVSNSESTNAASGNMNMGLMLAGLLQLEAARKESSVNASCTLTLYVGAEVLWSVNLCDADAVLASRNHIENIPHNLSLVWTPPAPRHTLRAASVIISTSRKGVPVENLCSASTVRLAPHGMESAVALQLRAPEGHGDEPCRLNIAAPASYILSLLLVSSGQQQQQQQQPADTGHSKPSCRLSLLVGCTSEYWSVDLCEPASAQLALNFTEGFPRNVTLVWTPPPPSQRHHQLASTVILTAIGRGKMCSHSQFYPCWRRPRAHPLCVSTELACDGYNNCPMDGNDEDPTVCQPNSKLIEAPGQESEGTRPLPATDHITELLQGFYSRHRLSNHTYRHGEETSPQSSPDTLSNYGPWGYLMLGMLVCGAFLMLCGLWECCCRQPKTTPGPPSHTPTTVLMPQPVLVLDSDLEDDPSRPPAYEDLDPPPPYGALFPGQPKDDAPPTSLLEDSTFPHMDADDVTGVTSSDSPS